MEPRPTRPHAASSSSVAALGNGNLLSTVLVVLLIITSIVTTAYLGLRLFTNPSNGGAVKGKQYQALFLTNGQVYFGHLARVDNAYVKLTDIYYLQVQQTVQPGQNTNNNNQNQQVSLAKLGAELHGPEDSMYVSRDQVLFWENLKNDGKVSQAIKDYQASGKK